MNKTVKGILMGTGITAATVAGVAAATNAATKYLVNCRLERELPGSREQTHSTFSQNEGSGIPNAEV